MQILLRALDSQFSLNLVIWIYPLAYLVHDLEETFTTERFARENRERYPKFFSDSTGQYIVVVGVLLVLSLLAAYLATGSPRVMEVFLILLTVFLLHIGVHVALSILYRKYTPGLVTAIVIVLPYSLYAFYRLFSAHLIVSNGFTLPIVAVGTLLFFPFLVMVHQLAKRLTRTHVPA